MNTFIFFSLFSLFSLISSLPIKKFAYLRSEIVKHECEFVGRMYTCLLELSFEHNGNYYLQKYNKKLFKEPSKFITVEVDIETKKIVSVIESLPSEKNTVLIFL